MEINPTYVTFEQAKLLKEKEFNEGCNRAYDGSECLYYSDNETKNTYNIFNRNLSTAYSAPEQWQVVEWLSLKGIEVSAQINFYNRKSKLGYYYTIDKFNEEGIHNGEDYDIDQFKLIGDKKGFNTRQEAYSAAFDYVLKNLI